jgi:hypothetical protein
LVGQGTLATSKPVRTVGSYWPYASTLFDYIRRAMPQNAPGSLSNDDVYAVSAYILNLNGLLSDGATLNAKSLPGIKMPNRNMFVGDPRRCQEFGLHGSLLSTCLKRSTPIASQRALAIPACRAGAFGASADETASAGCS